jgi:hypothetical protein
MLKELLNTKLAVAGVVVYCQALEVQQVQAHQVVIDIMVALAVQLMAMVEIHL